MSKIISDIKVLKQPAYSWQITTQQSFTSAFSAVITGNDTILINQGDISWNAGITTINIAGIYLCVYNVTMESNSINRRVINIIHSAQPSWSYGLLSTPPNTGGITSYTGSAIIKCEPTETIYFIFYQNSGSTLKMPASTSAADACEFSVCKML